MMMTNPLYFGMVEQFQLVDLDLPHFHYLNNVCIVGFTSRDLAVPNNNPIGMFYKNGTRRYLWDNKTWCDIDLPCEPLLNAITNKLSKLDNSEEITFYNRLLGIVKLYKIGYGPSEADSFGNQNGSSEVFYRSIYEINDK